MKAYLVQGEHPTVPGNPLLLYLTPELAAAAALDLVNDIRAEPYDVCDEKGTTLPQLPAGADWQEGLREWQRGHIMAHGVGEALVMLMDDDELADEAECTVWITPLVVQGVPELQTAVQPVRAAAVPQ